MTSSTPVTIWTAPQNADAFKAQEDAVRARVVSLLDEGVVTLESLKASLNKARAADFAAQTKVRKASDEQFNAFRAGRGPQVADRIAAAKAAVAAAEAEQADTVYVFRVCAARVRVALAYFEECPF